MASITFSSVGKVFPDGTRAVNNLNLEVREGEFVVLVGPSGCGKTTSLRMLAGLEEITEGEIRIDERLVNTVDPRRRDLAMVFQNYALYPHMNVFDNLAFPLRSHGAPRAEIKRRVEQTAKLLGLDELLKRKPRQLSGGQRQRVAMGRAIVREPQAFLMDEPLSNLDAKLRVQMRAEIANLQRKLGTTTVYVTHDQVEAMTMGSRIAVMRGGFLQQEGAPRELYESPINLFVATFIGAPAMNLISARVELAGDELSLVLGAHHLPAPTAEASRKALRAYAGKEVAVGIRSEQLIDAGEDHQNRPRLRGTVDFAEYLGGEQLVRIKLAARPVVADEVLEVAKDIDDSAVSELLREAAGETTLVTARFPAHAQVATGSTVEVAVVTDKIRLFDLATGGAIT